MRKTVVACWKNVPSNKIKAIKALRSFTTCNIREAKEFLECNTGEVIRGEVDEYDYESVKQSIIMAEGTVLSNMEFEKYYDDLKELAMKATLADDTVFAKELLEFINKFK